jgi:hypothetical protein
MARTWLALAGATALAVSSVWSAPLSAHHGSAAYDPDHVVTVTGTVTEFQFSNPHVLVYFEAKTDKGTADPWQGELTSPNRLGRVGWTKRTLKPGDSITVTGMSAKNGKHSLWIQKIIGPDGEPLPTASDTDR